MRRVTQIHRQAMEHAEAAFLLKRRGSLEEAQIQLEQAFQLEQSAAHQVARRKALEPTRSVLHRSAASLALQCGHYREAEKLIASALAGEPPPAIAEELRDLMEKIYQHRSSLQGWAIADQPYQFAEPETMQVIGTLHYADQPEEEAPGEVRLMDDEGVEHRVQVPAKRMRRTVRTLWGQRVLVVGTLEGTLLWAKRIEKREGSPGSG